MINLSRVLIIFSIHDREYECCECKLGPKWKTTVFKHINDNHGFPKIVV